MRSMFYNAKNFNQNLSSWEVGNVRQMENMFLNASKFDNKGKSLYDKWDVSNVTSCSLFAKNTPLLIDKNLPDFKCRPE